MLQKFLPKNKTLICLLCTITILICIFAIILTRTLRPQPEGIFVPIVSYHSVSRSEDFEDGYTISPVELEKDLVYLRSEGYTPVFVEDLINFVHLGKTLPEKPIILTFDDTTSDFYENVLPLLEKYDFKATLSVVGSFAESSDPRRLNCTQIKEIYESCRVEISNRSYSLCSLEKRRGATINEGESYESYRSVLLCDLEKNQRFLFENCGALPKVFTYPFGLVSEPSLRIVKNAGFKASLGGSHGENYITSDPDCLYNLSRHNRTHGVSSEDFFSFEN